MNTATSSIHTTDERNQDNVLVTASLLLNALACIRKRRRSRWPEWEQQALKLAPFHQKVLDACVKYARKCVRGRWEDLEPVILQAFATEPVVGRNCLKDRECEVDAIGDYIWAYLDVINGPWPEWEQEMLRLAAMNVDLLYSCVRYAKERIHGRWRDMEHLLIEAILTASQSYTWSGSVPLVIEWQLVFDYSAEVIQGPWPELETAMLDHGCLPTLGVSYAIIGRKSRLSALEERMLGPGYGSSLYDQIEDIVQYAAELFEGCRWLEAESFFKEALRQRSATHAAYAASAYAEQVMKGRWEAGEELLSGHPLDMYWYAKRALKHPLPDHLHSEMVTRSFEAPDDPHIRDYIKWCDEYEAAGLGRTP